MTLYNTVSYKTQDMSKLSADIDTQIDIKCQNKGNLNNHSHTITVTEVWAAINKLKHGKK